MHVAAECPRCGVLISFDEEGLDDDEGCDDVGLLLCPNCLRSFDPYKPLKNATRPSEVDGIDGIIRLTNHTDGGILGA